MTRFQSGTIRSCVQFSVFKHRKGGSRLPSPLYGRTSTSRIFVPLANFNKLAMTLSHWLNSPGSVVASSPIVNTLLWKLWPDLPYIILYKWPSFLYSAINKVCTLSVLKNRYNAARTCGIPILIKPNSF